MKDGEGVLHSSWGSMAKLSQKAESANVRIPPEIRDEWLGSKGLIFESPFSDYEERPHVCEKYLPEKNPVLYGDSVLISAREQCFS